MSWEQLAEIYHQNAETIDQERAEPPIYCPNDGTTLETGPNGELHCSFDGWIWDGQPGNR